MAFLWQAVQKVHTRTILLGVAEFNMWKGFHTQDDMNYSSLKGIKLISLSKLWKRYKRTLSRFHLYSSRNDAFPNDDLFQVCYFWFRLSLSSLVCEIQTYTRKITDSSRFTSIQYSSCLFRTNVCPYPC